VTTPPAEPPPAEPPPDETPPAETQNSGAQPPGNPPPGSGAAAGDGRSRRPFGEVLRVIANVWTSVTGGSSGISVPFSPPSLANYSFKLLRPHAYIALAALVIVTVIFETIRRGAMGYRLRAIKENPSAAEVIGIDTTKVKLQAAIISGMLMAMLGTLYAQVAVFFDPDTVFSAASISIRVALIAILGGIGTAVGPIVGALFIIPLEELMNDWFSASVAGLESVPHEVSHRLTRRPRRRSAPRRLPGRPRDERRGREGSAPERRGVSR